MSAPHHCGHCQRPIIGGDAYQCAACGALYHSGCWLSNGSCAEASCAGAAHRAVHLGPGGRLEQVAAPPPPPPARDGAGRRRPAPGQFGATQATASRPVRAEQEARSGVGLECPHCMLPVDSLDQPCPFCGRLPRIGRDVVVIDDQAGSAVAVREAPWGVQTIGMMTRFFSVMCFLLAAGMVIPAIGEANLGILLSSAMTAGMGWFNWRMGGDLLKRKAWSRTTMTVFSSLMLFGVPLGTAVGLLFLWGLHSEKADRFFEDRPQLPPGQNS